MKRVLKWIGQWIDYNPDCGRPTIHEFLQAVSSFDSVADSGLAEDAASRQPKILTEMPS